MQYIKGATILILGLFPVLGLIVKGASSIAIYLTLILGMLTICMKQNVNGQGFRQFASRYWLLNGAMSGMLVAALVHQVATGHFQFRGLGAPVRLAFFGVIFWLFLQLTSKQLKTIQWGLVAGAVAGMVLLYVETEAGVIRPFYVITLHLIPFANVALSMGFLALLSLGWNENSVVFSSKLTIGLKIMAVFAGLYASYLSQARGGWVMIPFFIFIAVRLFLKPNKKTVISTIVLMVVVVACLATFNKNIRDRIDVAKSDITSYMDGSNTDTSLGIRFQLWRGSLHIIKENPVFGVGQVQYTQELKKLALKKIISDSAATYTHSHNEALYQTALYGIFGLLSYILIFFVPAIPFIKGMGHSDSEVRTTACMGTALCLGFFIFGLSDVVLVWRGAATFYVLLVAALAAHLEKRNNELIAAGSKIRS